MAGVLVSRTSGFLRVHNLPAVLLHFVIILSCSCISTASAQDGKMKCTAMSVAPLGDTTLTCHFPEDLSVTKKDFTVYHYIKGRSQDAVVDCWWILGKLDCVVKGSFEYNKVVTTNLTVTLRRVTSALLGTYGCQVASYGPDSLETCEITPDNKCNFTYEKSGRGADLTCFFKEELEVTRGNFSVYKESGQGKHAAVAKCSWNETQPYCWVENGYTLDHSYLTLRVLEVTNEKAGNYSCSHTASNTEEQKTCSLVVAHEGLLTKDTNEGAGQQDNTALGVGLSIGLLVAGAGTAVLLLKYKEKVLSWFRTRRPSLQSPNADEERVLLPVVKDTDHQMITKEFQQYLEKETQAMFPKMFDTFYFVPPVYFNNVQFKTESVAGQVVFVPDPPDPKDFRHDQAMHRIHRYMAKHGQEKMFVLTQFKYDDYLNNPGNDFRRHRLPVPAGLTDENQNIQCFDLMIVHRLYGVLVGVVKAVGDNEGQDVQQPTNELIVHEVSNAVQQLKKAERMIRYLMSDQVECLRVRKALILPNLARTTYQQAVADHAGLDQEVRECLGANDPTSLCLCDEDLADAHSPRDPNVVSHVITRLRECLQRTGDDVGMTDDLYLSIISRFCGPATQSSLECHNESISLPKTQVDALSVIGDLYQRPILYRDMLDLLPEERLCLVGPLNTGKTRLLTLAGLNWLATGHDVHVLCGPSGSRDSEVLAFLNKSKQNTPGSVFEVHCNFNRKKDMEDTLKSLTKKKEENALCVLADDVDNIGNQLKPFCEALERQYPDLHLWITSSSDKNLPGGWKKATFTWPLNCPPSVAREASRAGANYSVSYGRNQTPCCLFPTDGPDVEYIYHKKSPLKHNCTECGQIVANTFLAIKEDNVATVEKTTSASAPSTSGEEESTALKRSVLRFKDLLVLYEGNGQQLIDGLKSKYIPVCTFEANKDSEVSEREDDCAFVMHVDMLKTYRPRRKIVVYVEYKLKPKEPSHKWRGITSCTSQLIVMRRNE